MKRILSILLATSFLIISGFQSVAQKKVNKTFDAKEKIIVSIVSGECTVEKGGDKFEINLSYTYSDDCYEYKFIEEEGYLKIKEEFDGKCDGESIWKIKVPAETNITLNSASGDISVLSVGKNVNMNTASGDVLVENVSGNVNANTASGGIDITNVAGDVDVNTASGHAVLSDIKGETNVNTASGRVKLTDLANGVDVNGASSHVFAKDLLGRIHINLASGDVEIENAKGEFNINTASGRMELSEIVISGVSDLNSASGKINLSLSKTCEHDLSLNTASGNVILDYNGNPLKGYYEFVARVDKGKIVSPEKFDTEEVIEKNGKDYDKKSFTKGSTTPKIKLSTSSGTVELVK